MTGPELLAILRDRDLRGLPTIELPALARECGLSLSDLHRLLRGLITGRQLLLERLGCSEAGALCRVHLSTGAGAATPASAR